MTDDHTELAPTGSEEQAAPGAERQVQCVFALDLARRVTGLLSPGELVVDAGVAAGEQTLLLALIYDVRVLVFQPEQDRAELLRASIALANVASRFDVRRATLGERASRSDDDALVVPLDLVALSSPPRLIRINAVGSALAPLVGAEHTIRTHRPYLHLESTSTVDLGEALALLGQWGYWPDGQLGATPNIFCAPSPPAGWTRSNWPSPVGASYSVLESTVMRLRRLTPLQSPPPSQGAASTEGSKALGPAVAELARRLDQTHAILEQQVTQTRRMEAHLVTVKRRLELLAAPQSVASFALPKRGTSSAKQRFGRMETVGRKLQKLGRDPVRFLLDSRSAALRLLGSRLPKKP